MNKFILPITATLLLSACITDPNSPFYTGDAEATPAVVEIVETTDAVEVPSTVEGAVEGAEEAIDEVVEDAVAVVEDTAEEAVQVATGGQCLSSDVLANTTYSVVAKGTKGTVEKSGGKEYFVAGGTRHDVTNVPYSLTSC